MSKNEEIEYFNVISKKNSIDKLLEDSKKSIISNHSKFKISKNESFSSNSKSHNTKEFLKKKVLTFESAFKNNNKSNPNTLYIPQLQPNSSLVGNSLNIPDFSNKVPINININNYNINNFHILKNDRVDNSSSINYIKKNFSNNVLNTVINNNNSTGLENNNNNFFIRQVNYHPDNPFSRKILSNLNNSNEAKLKNKCFFIDGSNSKFVINKNIKKFEFKPIEKENLKVKLNNYDEKKTFIPVNRDKQYSEKSEIKPLEKIVPDDFYNKSRKEKIKIKTYSEDQNDSLIEELANFLNNDNTSKAKKECKQQDKLDLSKKDINNLDNLININDYEQPFIAEEIKNTRNTAQKNFLEINEKQIISSSTNNLNNNNLINYNDVCEEGPPINYEHFQQVNSKRPQTSYGGLSARQKSLQNSLRQLSSKYDERQENNNHINPNNNIDFRKNYINPFEMKNKLNQIKYLFNN